MDQFFAAVSEAGFSTEIIQKLKEMIEEPDDLQLLNAKDIRQMFPNIGMKEKKALWKFISEQQELSAQQKTPHQSRGGTVFQTGSGSMSMGAGNYAPHAQLAGTINNAPRDSSNVTGSSGHATRSNIADRDISTTNYNASKGQGNVNMEGGNIGGQAQVGNQNTYNAPQDTRNVRVSVRQATRSNIAGGSISSTTYNTRQVGAYGEKKRKLQNQHDGR